MAMPAPNASYVERISDPPIPYAAAIPGGVFPGRAITVRGRVLAGIEVHRFNIDLCCGLLVQGDHQDDKALHVNPRFIKKRGLFSSSDEDIVLNALINNKWGAEERYGNVLREGESFVIRILIIERYFKVAVNGKHLCDFVHRVPLTAVNTIFVSGAVRVDVIEFEGARPSAPAIGDGATMAEPAINSSTSDGADTIQRKPSVPFCHYFRAGSLLVGKEVSMTATPKMHATGFAFNVLRDADYLFHLRIDMPSGREKGAIVRNNCINNRWVSEERETTFFPFTAGITFDLKVLFGPQCIVVHVDERHLCNFNYRSDIALAEVNAISAVGDITIHLFELK